MRILSFDIGIINMAYCLIEAKDDENIRVIDWKVVDTTDLPECSLCKKKSKTYVFLTSHKDPNATAYYCSTHTKSYAEKHYLKKNINKIGDNLDYESLGSNLYNLLESQPHLTEDIDCVLFENQPVYKNPKMKTVQIILYSYFLFKKTLIKKNIGTLKFYMPKRKLEISGIEIPDLDKSIYKDRKKMSILYTKEILNKLGDSHNIHQISNVSKSDDLCDAFIQGIEYLQSIGRRTF